MQVETWLIEGSSDGRLEGLLLTQLELWLGFFRFESVLGDPDTDRNDALMKAFSTDFLSWKSGIDKPDALMKAFSTDSLSWKSGIDKPDALIQNFPTQILDIVMILTDFTVSIC